MLAPRCWNCKYLHKNVQTDKNQKVHTISQMCTFKSTISNGKKFEENISKWNGIFDVLCQKMRSILFLISAEIALNFILFHSIKNDKWMNETFNFIVACKNSLEIQTNPQNGYIFAKKFKRFFFFLKQRKTIQPESLVEPFARLKYASGMHEIWILRWRMWQIS